MEKEILLTKSAARIITAVSKDCDVETGGVLAGLLGDPIIILGAGLPGADAVHKACSFTTDPNADENCLLECRDIYGLSIDVCGWYHKHTLLQTPSEGDRLQAINLKEDFSDGKPTVMGIVSTGALMKSDLTLRFFGLDDNNEIIEFRSEVIPDESPSITEAIDNMPIRPDYNDCDFWKEDGFQFYKNNIGRKRICSEILELKKLGLKVTVGRAKTDQSLVLYVANNSRQLQLAFPPEYPLNPPAILDYQGARIVGLRVIREWNSQETLSDLMVEAFKASQYSKHLLKRLIGKVNYENKC